MPAIIDRRNFIKAAGAGFLASLSTPAADALANTDALFASACRFTNKTFGAVLFDERGAIVRTIPLPLRGHDITGSPAGDAFVIFARRPGNLALVIDRDERKAPQTITAPQGRHFYGHGAYSADGRLLYASENDFGAARGCIGIYDATDAYRRIGEFESYGTGPHEILLLPDGKTLAVANGGIETHPDYPRAKLNLATMSPSLAFMDASNGTLIERHTLPTRWHQLSIRHMAAGADGRVYFGVQNEGAKSETLPLIGEARIGDGIGMWELPEPDLAAFRHYIGSVAINADAGLLACSSPKGGVSMTFSLKDRQVQSRERLRGVCGIAPNERDFIRSTEGGDLAGGGAHLSENQIAFDNHIARLD